MKWREATFEEAILHSQTRLIEPEAEKPKGYSFDEDVIIFADGTAIAVHSCWTGPYSEVTPDVDSDVPKWRIFK